MPEENRSIVKKFENRWLISYCKRLVLYTVHNFIVEFN